MFAGTVRPLRSEDREAVEAIFDLYWSGDLNERFKKRLAGFLSASPESKEEKYAYFVAEEGDEIVGVAALRKAPSHMKQYTQTGNPAEFYILAVKYKGRGIGSALREKRIEEAKQSGFTEIVLYSAESHKDSWKFHDRSDFKRIAAATAPNGEAGYVWRMAF